MKLSTKSWTYDEIIQYISEEEIAMRYLGVNSKSKMFSFFREETVPGQYLYYKNGKMQYFDCVENRSLPYLIMEIYSWSYKQFIECLKQDFMLTGISTITRKKLPKIKDKDKHTDIRIKRRDWEQKDIDYWGKGGITLDWLKDPRRNITPISYYWINDYLHIADELAYTYIYYYHRGLLRKKIYQPYNIENKWVSNINSTVLQNISTIPKTNDNELLIISSSYKDAGVIECNLTLPNSRLYLPSIAPNAEGVYLPPQIPYKLKQRYKRIVTFFDQDLAGHKAARKYEQKYGYKPIFIPEGWAKDPFAFTEKYGKEEFIKLSNYLLYE